MNNAIRMGMRHLPKAVGAFGFAMNMPKASCDAEKKTNQIYIASHPKTPELLTYENDGVEFNRARTIVSQAREMRAKLKGPYEEYSEIHGQANQSPLDVDLKESEKLFISLSTTFNELEALVNSRGKFTEKTGLESEFQKIKNECKAMYSEAQEFRTEIFQKVPLEYLKKYHSELMELKNKLELAVMLQDPEIADKRAIDYVEKVKEAFSELPPIIESSKLDVIKKLPNVEEIASLLKEIGELKSKTKEEIESEGKGPRTEELDKELIAWCCSHIEYASEVDPFINQVLIPAGLNKGLLANDWDLLRAGLKTIRPQKPAKTDTFDSLKMIEQAVAKMDSKALLEGRISEKEILEMAKVLQSAKLETGLEYLMSVVKEKVGRGFSFTELHSQMRQNISKIKEVYKTAYDNIGVIISGTDEEKAVKKQLKKERVELLSDILFEVNSIENLLDQGVEEAKRSELFADIEKMRQELYALSNDYNQSADTVDGQPSKEILAKLKKAHKELEAKVQTEALSAIKHTSNDKNREYRQRVLKVTMHLLTDIAPRLEKDSEDNRKIQSKDIGCLAENSANRVMKMQEDLKTPESQRTWFGAIASGLQYTAITAVAGSALAAVAYMYKII